MMSEIDVYKDNDSSFEQNILFSLLQIIEVDISQRHKLSSLH